MPCPADICTGRRNGAPGVSAAPAAVPAMGHAAAANAERRKHPPAGNGRIASPEGEMRATEFGQKPGFPRLEIPVFVIRKGTEAAPQADSQRQHVHRAACAWVLLVFVFGSVAVNHGKEGGLLFLRHPGDGKGIEKSRNDSFFLCTILPLLPLVLITGISANISFFKSYPNSLDLFLT